jgi:hypothetical protein
MYTRVGVRLDAALWILVNARNRFKPVNRTFSFADFRQFDITLSHVCLLYVF